ncbi:MAG: PAC2 family protein [Candidatus Thorarchaeota archaeon]
MRELRFMDIDVSSLKSPVAILGLPGIGNVGRIAVDALIQALDAPPLLEFYSEDFPPRIIVRDGISEFPKSTIHLYRAAPDEPHDLLLLTADHQPSSGKGVFDYADYVAGIFNDMNIREVFALAAYEQSYEEFFKVYPSPPRVFISASSQLLLEKIAALDGTILTREGVISGANGFIPSWAAKRYGADGACILGETMGVIKADFRASREIMQKIAELLGLKSNLDLLDEQASRVADFIEWAKKEIEQRAGFAEDGDSPPDSYIG